MADENKTEQGGFKVPKEFFTAGSFGTVTGCAAVTWLVSGVVCGTFKVDAAHAPVIGLVVAMVVAYAGLAISRLSGEKIKGAQFVITFFNGFLIYATVVGGTSVLPYFNPETAKAAQDNEMTFRASFTRPWLPDRNLVGATRDLLEIAHVQTRALNQANMELAEVRSRLSGPEAISETGRRELLTNVSRTEEGLATTEHTVTITRDSLRRVGLEPSREETPPQE